MGLMYPEGRLGGIVPYSCGWSVSVGVALNAGFGVLVDVPGVPGVPGMVVPAVTVPVPRVAVNVNRMGFTVSVGVGCVGVLVFVETTGVWLGASVGEGRASRVCCEMTAAVA